MEENIFRKTAETRTVIGSFLQSHEKEKNEFIDMIVVLRGYVDEFDKSWRKYVDAESKDDVRKSYVKVRGKEAKLNEFVGSVLDACTGNKRFYEKYWDDICYVKKKICDILCELPRKPREVLEKTTFDFSIDLADEFVEKAEEMNTDVEFISTETEEGMQLFRAFGGIGAILRYYVEY